MGRSTSKLTHSKLSSQNAIASSLLILILSQQPLSNDPTNAPRTIREQVAQDISTKRAQYPRFQPHLVIIQAGSRPDSSVYVRMKEKAAAEVGIKYTHVQLPADAKVEQVVKEVQRLNADESVSGILVQLPLGDHVDSEGERKVTEAISPEKDVDG